MADQDQFLRDAYTDYTIFLQDTMDWRREVDKMRKYYYGNQYSTAMSEKYAQRGWTDLVINKLRPLVKNRISRMIASRPQGKVFGFRQADMATAFALNELLDYHYYNSEGQMQFEDAATYQLREGVGYLIAFRDWLSDCGRGELKFMSESYENVFTRKSSRQWDYKDAGRIIHSRLVDRADIAYRLDKWVKGVDLDGFLHPYDIPRFVAKKKDKKQDVIGFPETTTGGNRNIREFDIYDLVHMEIRAVHYIPTNTVIQVDENYTPTDSENAMIKDGIIRFDKFIVPRIKYNKFIGNGTNSLRIGKEEHLPIEFFPVVPIHNERTGNSCSLGEIHFFYGMQEMLNQSSAIMVMHAAMASLFKVIIDTRIFKGDLDKFQDDWAALGAVVGLESDPETGKLPMDVVRPEQINQAFWSMAQFFASELEYQSGSSPLSWGQPTRYAPETMPPLLLLNEWSDNNLRLHLSHFEIAVERLYTVLLQWAKSFYGYKTFLVERGGNEFENFINSPMPLDSGFRDQQGNAILSMNNIKELKTRFRIKLGSTVPAPTQQYMQIFQNWAQKYPVFLKHAVKYMEIPEAEKQELMESVDVLKQQQVEIQRLNQYLTTIGKALRNEMAKNIQLEQDAKVTQVAHRAEKTATKQRAEAEIALAELKSKGEGSPSQ